jgi:hypothetical protein
MAYIIQRRRFDGFAKQIGALFRAELLLLQKFAPGILLLLLIEALNKEDTAEFGVEFAQEALNRLHNYRFAFIIFVHVDLGDF